MFFLKNCSHLKRCLSGSTDWWSPAGKTAFGSVHVQRSTKIRLRFSIPLAVKVSEVMQLLSSFFFVCGLVNLANEQRTLHSHRQRPNGGENKRLTNADRWSTFTLERETQPETTQGFSLVKNEILFKDVAFTAFQDHVQILQCFYTKKATVDEKLLVCVANGTNGSEGFHSYRAMLHIMRVSDGNGLFGFESGANNQGKNWLKTITSSFRIEKGLEKVVDVSSDKAGALQAV